MQPHDFWQHVHPPMTFERQPEAGHRDLFPAEFDDGRQLALPIRELADGQRALASLIINQASFAVEDALCADLAAKVVPYEADVVVGLPTLGLTLASGTARKLGMGRLRSPRDLAQVLVSRQAVGTSNVCYEFRSPQAPLHRSSDGAAHREQARSSH